MKLAPKSVSVPSANWKFTVLSLSVALASVGAALADGSRVIQYDEGNFGKINLHDLESSGATTYSPLTYVKRPKYVSALGERPLIDKQYKHNFDQEGDENDSRYVYRYVDPELKIFDLPEGEHLEPLVRHFQDRVAQNGVEEESLAKRIKIARQYGLEILLNYRVNDVHWGGPKPVRPELQSEFALKHPEFQVNPAGEKWKDGALNFAIKEVRDYLLGFYEEGLNRFDNDGILIDMMRNPTFFPPGTGWENREHLTEFVRQVRHLVDHSCFAKEGKKMTLGMRVPPTVAYCEKVGMDVRKWAQEGLVDFLAVSTFMKQDPNLQVAAFRQSVGITDTAIYATLQRRNYGFGQSASFGQYRGMAANMWGHEKAEGLLLFNWMQQSRKDYERWKSGDLLIGPHPDLVRELHSLETLAGRNKVYSIAWGQGDQYPDLPFYNPLPIEIPRLETRAVRFGAFEGLPANTPEWITIVVQANPDRQFRIRLNGMECRVMAGNERDVPIRRITGGGLPDKNRGVNDASIKRNYAYFDAPVAALIDGLNEIEYRALKKGRDEAVTIIRTDVFVSHGSEKEHGTF